MNKTPTSDRLGYKSFYRRNLPHIQPVGATLFVTFRLAGSLPQQVLAQNVQIRFWADPGIFGPVKVSITTFVTKASGKG
ncbi:MAG TPA: hypothetical protein VIF81_10025 [Pyrinomonadaceae bacterium]|jgi:hypothetical protein